MIFVLTNDDEAQALWAFLKDKWRDAAKVGKPLMVEVGQATAPQTRRQQMRYRAILRRISQAALVRGVERPPEYWHGLYALMFLGEELNPQSGKSEPISTTTLNRADFNDHVEKIIQHATVTLGLELDLMP